MTQESQSPRVLWHRLLGKLLEEVLTPVGIEVYTEFPVTNTPPAADVLLLRREENRWTAEQRARLPDGVRHTTASHILLEFKYTESVNRKALRQAIVYDTLYKQSQPVSDQDVATFIISVRKPHKTFLQRFAYQPARWPGVYHSQNPMLDDVGLLSLNELTDEAHNVFVKCFASRKREKQAAFQTMQTTWLSQIPNSLVALLAMLWSYWFTYEGEAMMELQLTPEHIEEMKKMWGKVLIEAMTPEERLAGLQPEERLAGLQPEEIEEIEAYLRQLKERKKKDNKGK